MTAAEDHIRAEIATTERLIAKAMGKGKDRLVQALTASLQDYRERLIKMEDEQ